MAGEVGLGSVDLQAAVGRVVASGRCTFQGRFCVFGVRGDGLNMALKREDQQFDEQFEIRTE